tara:strand:- start:531 stop:734 length:204 start_codon:yes stop_codon:yes gene_type:complete
MKVDIKMGNDMLLSFDSTSANDSLMKDYIESLQNKLNFGMSFNQYKKWVEKSVLYDPGVIPENESIH